MKRIAAALLAASLPGLASAAEINLVDQLAEGGAAALVTLGLSILFLAVTIERFLHLRARAVVPSGLVARIEPLWTAHRFAEIDKLLAEDGSTLARVVAWLVAHRHQPYEVVSSAAGDMASMELRQHQQKAYALAIVATVAPIVGLLGTVVGMIEAFHVIAYAEGMGNPALLAGGISKALVNTAAGLTVALPALGMHHYFKHRLTTLGLALEREINALINQRFLPQPEAPALRMVQHAH
ncbi:biopolymer transport protein ExbB [Pelomonas aquatica]|uniref:Biopolymer transport protein ExbB n=1 Tax=Pelomonas aquatica TaxID=431058 RepID=A0ABU1Z5J0_9BURK|nr:MotA/TolQ/ExbB proton channel family protein [Pelomonas aquatica]MDR7295862.1 biopolymer transport protein ExbB [Pelomonas aquatica]